MQKMVLFHLNTFLFSSNHFIINIIVVIILLSNNNNWKLIHFVLSFVHLQVWEASGGSHVILADDTVAMTTRGEPLTRVTWQNES